MWAVLAATGAFALLAVVTTWGVARRGGPYEGDPAPREPPDAAVRPPPPVVALAAPAAAAEPPPPPPPLPAAAVHDADDDPTTVYMPYQRRPAEVAGAPPPPRGGVLAGPPEGGCGGRYNVGCKMFFYLRCGVLGHLPAVRWVRSVDAYTPHAAAGDVVLVIDRPSARAADAVPGEVAALLAARAAGTIPASVAVGLYHTADEERHDDWGWYPALDLILRHYFVPALADRGAHPHLLHVPIGPVAPGACTPASPEGLGVTDVASSVADAGDGAGDYCTCPGLPPLAPPSARPVGYHLAALVHRDRQGLFDAVAAAAAASPPTAAAPRLGNGTGLVEPQGTFGGDAGTIGSADADPKIPYLAAMAAAAIEYVPCGNVMETHRLYEALLMGALPLVEACEAGARAWMPAPADALVVGGGSAAERHAAMVATATALMGDPPRADALAAATRRRWRAQLDALAADVRALLDDAVGRRRAVAAAAAAAGAAPSDAVAATKGT